MSRIVDKIIILALSVFAMYLTMHGKSFVVSTYISIIFSAVNYYLINTDKASFLVKPSGIKEWLAIFLELIVVILALFYSPAIIILPLITYDITRSRNYLAFILSIMAIINAFFYSNKYPDNLNLNEILFVSILIILAIVLSIRSERLSLISHDYNRLRDDSAEISSKLRLQNNELLQARDTEVYNAQLSERNRIAREIHDNVGHTLSRAILQMGALLAIHKEEPIHSELEEVRQTLDTAMNNIRSSVHDLHDDSIDVKSSIYQMAEPLKDNYDLKIDIDIANDMSRPIKYTCIGITKECISNIIKHSKNTTVDIKLNEHPSIYQLVIHDYTPGGKSKSINTDKSTSKNKSDMDTGMGLENIRNRAESVNGTVNISKDNGFRVFVSIPK